jgi:hypothetical protein
MGALDKPLPLREGEGVGAIASSAIAGDVAALATLATHPNPSLEREGLK